MMWPIAHVSDILAVHRKLFLQHKFYDQKSNHGEQLVSRVDVP